MLTNVMMLNLNSWYIQREFSQPISLANKAKLENIGIFIKY